MVRKLAVLFLLVFTTATWAATISVKVDRDTVAVNESFRIIFRAEGSLDGEPDFSPLNEDFELQGTGQSSQFSMINGNVTSSKSYTLTVSPLRPGKLTIPPISFGRDQSPAKEINVTAAIQRKARPMPLAPAADPGMMFVTLEADTLEPYVQQQVILKLKVFRRKQWKDASLSDPNLGGVEASIQQLGKTTTYDTTVKGVRYQVSELRFALFPQQSGELTIQPFHVTARFPAGVKKQRPPYGGFSNDPFFDNFFSRQSYEPRTARSEAITVNVKPIPATFTGSSWLPASDLQLQQTWSGDIDQVQTGEPITRTIAVIGDGVSNSQLPDIKIPDSNQYRSYPDQPVSDEQVTEAGLLSTRSYRFAIIPTQPGNVQLPAIEIPWWDTRADRMRIARLDATSLSVTGEVPATQTAQTPGAAPVNTPDTDARTPADPPVGPGTIAEDTSVTVRLLVIAVIVLAAFWLITLFYLLRKRPPTAMVTTDHSDKDSKARIRASLADLKSACEHDDADQVRDALIAWSKLYWPDDPATSLETIAERLPQTQSDLITQLSTRLYSPQETPWDAGAIYEAISQLPLLATTSNQGTQDTLEPLYR